MFVDTLHITELTWDILVVFLTDCILFVFVKVKTNQWILLSEVLK